MRITPHHAPLLIPLLSSAIVQSVAVTYYFMRDDFLHLYQVANLPLKDSLMTPHGGHLCVVLNFVFYGFLRLFGVNSLPHSTLMLVTHLVNVALLYHVLLSFTNKRSLSSVLSTLWGICPIHQGSLAYFSVYGHVIAVTFLLVFLLDLGRLRMGRLPFRPSLILRWPILLIGASLSFGVGVGAAMVSGACTWCLLYGVKERLKATALLLCLVVLVPAIYYGLHPLYYATPDGSLDRFNDPAFHQPHLSIRTAAVLCGLVGYGFSSLLFGAVLVPWPGAGPPLLYLASVGACLVAWAALRGASTAVRFQLAGVAMLLLAVCGVIALGRTVLVWREPLSFYQIVAVPRYCYAPSMICAIFSALVAARVGWPREERSRSRGILVACLSVAALGMLVASQRAAKAVMPQHRQDRDVRREYETILHSAVEMAAAIPSGAALYVRNVPTEAISIASIDGVDGRFPGAAAVFVIGTRGNEVRGRRVYFVEADTGVVKALRRRSDTRISALLVTEEEARGASTVTIRF
jgi:hypothetical protein